MINNPSWIRYEMAGDVKTFIAHFDRTQYGSQSKVLLGIKVCDLCPTSRKLYMFEVLRTDDLLMPPATMSCVSTSLCCKKRELLPFVIELKHLFE